MIKKRGLLLMVFVVSLVVGNCHTAFAAGSNPIGTVSAIEGRVLVLHSGEYKWEVLKLKDKAYLHDQVRTKHPDMVLLHGGSPKGAELIAAKWAEARGVTQVAFKPDWTKHAKAAPFKRNDAMLDVLPVGVLVFPGTGIQPTAGITLSETSLILSIGAGTTASLPLTIGNTGSYQLDYVTNATDGSKSDLPWLTVTPETGTVHPSSVKTLSVKFDSNFLWAGTHTADLVISSNDPAHPDTLVAVELMVTPVSAVGDGLPRHLVFHGAVPNPFNPVTEIGFDLPEPQRVELAIYAVNGRRVATLKNEQMIAGRHSVTWTGQNDAGERVASGIYFCRLKAGAFRETLKMTLVK